jgi:hypothetical protein
MLSKKKVIMYMAMMILGMICNIGGNFYGTDAWKY